jgi:hypothetical protein
MLRRALIEPARGSGASVYSVRIYQTLPSLTNLYRTASGALLEWVHEVSLMFQQWLRYSVLAVIAASLSGVRAFGSSPTEDRLLRLVPANAAIVAGIQDPHHGDQSGRLLIVTHNNNVDLNDWIALVGVDGTQKVDRLIEVAMPSPRGDLAEHLLLASGSFDGKRILADAEKNGGNRTEYKGVRIVNLKPFPREQQEIRDTRWLTVLDDNTVLFGTPITVMGALDRYLSSSGVDGSLAKQLEALKPDVNCWSVLTMPGAVLARHLRAGVLDETGAVLLGRVSSVAVGMHYGSKERVDFSIATNSPEAATALAAAMDRGSSLLPIADTLRTRFAGVSVEQNEVRGSVRVAGKEFDGWLTAVYARLSTDRGLGGENVARAGAVR